MTSMPLAMAERRQRLTVTSIHAAGPLQSRLAGMGLIPGVELEILQHHSDGYSILRVQDTRLSVGRGLLQCIRVHESGAIPA